MGTVKPASPHHPARCYLKLDHDKQKSGQFRGLPAILTDM
jgi:hypothetical protein